MEILDICDELGNPTGKTVERKIAHQQGILHRTAHVWILRKKENKIQILLQKRSEQKDSFPGCYDISSAGHIPAGDNYGQSAVRELKEELGIVVRESELIDCGNRRFHFEEIFHGRLFKDNQVSKIFVLWKDLEEKDFVFVDHEVSEVKWLDFEKCYQDVKENKIKIEDIDENLVSDNLYTKGQPDPDLLIRTSGEMRTSNFLPWQIVYSEFLFVNKNWPDFNEEDLDNAIIEYQKRTRKFGAN